MFRRSICIQRSRRTITLSRLLTSPSLQTLSAEVYYPVEEVSQRVHRGHGKRSAVRCLVFSRPWNRRSTYACFTRCLCVHRKVELFSWNINRPVTVTLPPTFSIEAPGKIFKRLVENPEPEKRNIRQQAAMQMGRNKNRLHQCFYFFFFVSKLITGVSRLRGVSFNLQCFRKRREKKWLQTYLRWIFPRGVVSRVEEDN